jgi:hypothetical protein
MVLTKENDVKVKTKYKILTNSDVHKKTKVNQLIKLASLASFLAAGILLFYGYSWSTQQFLPPTYISANSYIAALLFFTLAGPVLKVLWSDSVKSLKQFDDHEKLESLIKKWSKCKEASLLIDEVYKHRNYFTQGDIDCIADVWSEFGRSKGNEQENNAIYAKYLTLKSNSVDEITELQNELKQYKEFFNSVFIYQGNYPCWKAEQEFRQILKAYDGGDLGKSIDLKKQDVLSYLVKIVDATNHLMKTQASAAEGKDTHFWSDDLLPEARGARGIAE